MNPIVIKVGNVVSQIEGLNDADHIKNLDKILSYYVEGYRHTKAYKKGFYNKKTGKWDRWDGKKHLLTKKHTLPSGVIHYAEDYFKKKKVLYQVDDLRLTPKSKDELPIICDFEDREYQERCVVLYYQQHTLCI